MISRRGVGYLGALTLLTALAAGLAVADRLSATRTRVDAEPVYPGFAREAGAVHRIEVIRAADSEDGSVSLLRTGDSWLLEQRDGFPARTDAIRKLLFDIGELQLIERKTADPGRFERLDLRDVARPGSRASRLVMTTADGETLVDLHIGKRLDSLSGGKPMVYLRRTGDTRTYLAEGALDLPGRAPLWLFRSIVDVPQAEIQHTTTMTADGERTILERVEEAGRDFRIVDLPDDRRIDSQYRVNNAATVLDKLLFDDVRSADGLKFSPELGHAAFTTDAGVIYTVAFAEAPPDDTANETADAAPARWVRVGVTIPQGVDAAVRARAEADRAATAGWAYRISDWEMQRLTASLASLTEPAEGG